MRLAERTGGPVYERELLRLHAHSISVSATAIPVLVLLIACAGFFVGLYGEMLIWAVAAVTFYAGLAFVAKRVEKAGAEFETARARNEFLAAHFASGLGWTWFATIGCHSCALANFTVIQAIVLLLAIAATAILAHALKNVLFVTFLAPVGVFVMTKADLGSSLDVIMSTLLTISLPFFSYIASRLNKSTQMLLSFRTEKDALIAELETAKSMSDEARRRAEEANLAKSRFLASMSHELRTPLNAILGFSEVMANEVLGPMHNATYKEYAGDIHSSGEHLLHLINEILDLSRIEAGRYQLNEGPVSLADIADDCCHLVALRAQSKQIRVVQKVEPGLPRLRADERAIRQVVLNLLSNAVKFTPSGGEVAVVVGWTAGGGQYVAVRDNGPGIPPEEIPIVLSAFGQGSIAIKSAEQGTGLGLPIVQALVNMHGGQFELKSKLREGTEAIAVFPASRVMETAPAKTAAHGGRR
ncbi:MAG: HAMP domain-containing histidine kinase [Phyllobacteriaceae bacterium]|nr:HAMP domain-containing histidine kinase [Phyllobacteriaceae bacterium]